MGGEGLSTKFILSLTKLSFATDLCALKNQSIGETQEKQRIAFQDADRNGPRELCLLIPSHFTASPIASCDLLTLMEH